MYFSSLHPRVDHKWGLEVPAQRRLDARTRPTITSALDEYSRCPMGFYSGFEPPSCLSVMRCLKHAILPKTYVQREYPAIKNRWDCYGVPELVVVDSPAEFHSSHFERACLQLGADIGTSPSFVSTR